MKLAIVGSRSFDNYEYLCKILSQSKQPITEVISGGARGADGLGAKYAKDNNIDLTEFPAEWDKYGKSAGYRRNRDIVDACDCLIAFWDGESKGTKHSIDLAKQDGKMVAVVYYNEKKIEKFNH